MSGLRYVFDANVIIDMFERFYPEDVFPGVLSLVEKVANEDRMIVPRDVVQEIGAERYSKWLDELAVVADFDAAITEAMLEVMSGVGKRMVDPRPRRSNSGADPIVLAYAIRFDACVLTSEKSQPTATWVKLPDACAERDVECYDLVSFFREEGLRL